MPEYCSVYWLQSDHNIVYKPLYPVSLYLSASRDSRLSPIHPLSVGLSLTADFLMGISWVLDAMYSLWQCNHHYTLACDRTFHVYSCLITFLMLLAHLWVDVLICLNTVYLTEYRASLDPQYCLGSVLLFYSVFKCLRDSRLSPTQPASAGLSILGESPTSAGAGWVWIIKDSYRRLGVSII